jgi:hypothetical protein
MKSPMQTFAFTPLTLVIHIWAKQNDHIMALDKENVEVVFDN